MNQSIAGLTLAVAGCLVVSLQAPSSAAGSGWQQLEGLAREAYAAGHLKEAEENYSNAIAQIEKSGKSQQDLARCLTGLAAVYTQEGKVENAERLYKRSLEILTRALGTNNSGLIQT